MWGADKLYVLLFKTFRVDDVEITALHTGGTQISFVNPQGFEPKSGEYVRVLIPWHSVGPFQWHPFSIYTGQHLEARGVCGSHSNPPSRHQTIQRRLFTQS